MPLLTGLADESRESDREKVNKRQREREIVRRSDLHSISHNGTKDEQIGLAVGLSHVSVNATSGALQP